MQVDRLRYARRVRGSNHDGVLDIRVPVTCPPLCQSPSASRADFTLVIIWPVAPSMSKFADASVWVVATNIPQRVGQHIAVLGVRRHRVAHGRAGLLCSPPQTALHSAWVPSHVRVLVGCELGGHVAAPHRLHREVGLHLRRLVFTLRVRVRDRGPQVGTNVGVLRHIGRRRGLVDGSVGPVLGTGLGPLPLGVGGVAPSGIGDPGGEADGRLRAAGPTASTLPSSSTLVTLTVTVSVSLLLVSSVACTSTT